MADIKKVYVVRSIEKGIHLTNFPEIFTIVWCRDFDPIKSPIDREKLSNNEPIINTL